MNRQWLSLTLVLLTTCVWAQTERPATSWRLQRVSADDTALWPRGDWRPVSRVDLDRYLDAAALPPGAVPAPQHTLWQAVYNGRWDGEGLRGTCRLTLPRGLPSGAEVRLDPLGLRLADLRDAAGPAVWGGRHDGETVIVPRDDAATLDANWEAAGRPVFDGWEFELRLPQAAISRLVLDLPQGWNLRTSAGVASGPTAGDAGSSRWIVEAGRRTELQLTLTPAGDRHADDPLWIVTHTVSVLGDGLEVVSDFSLSAGETRELECELPDALQVLTVTYAADMRLPYSIGQQNAQRRLKIVAPGAGGWREGRIRVRAFIATALTEPLELPLPRLFQHQPVELQVTLHVRPPQVLNLLQPDGYRIADRRADTDGVESWTLQALRGDPALMLAVATPTPQLRARVLQWADYRSPVARLKTRLLLQGGGGPTFEIQARCPAEWDVVGVAPFRGEAATIIAGFECTPEPHTGWQLLTVQLRQPLDVGDEIDLLISAVAAVPEPATSLTVPCLQPPGVIQGGGLLALWPPAGTEVSGRLTLSSSADVQLWLPELQAVADGADLSQALLFECPHGGPEIAPDTISFDPSAAILESPAATGAPGEVTAVLSSGTPDIAELRVRTSLAAPGASGSTHVAEGILQQPFVGLAQFTLLSPAEQVQLEVDGVPTPVQRTPLGYSSLAPVTARQSLTVKFVTPVSDRSLWTDCELPLPQWSVRGSPCTWWIESSPGAACWQMRAPYARVVAERRSTSLERLFGPLAARESKSGKETVPGASRTVPGWRGQGVLQVEVAVTPVVLAYSLWNPELAERGAWALLMLTLMTGATVRRLRWRRVRSLLPWFWLSLLTVAWLAPDPFARLAGAACVGIMLSLWLPRRLMIRDTPAADPFASEPPEDEVTKVKLPPRLVTGAGAVSLMLWNVAWLQSQTVTEPERGAVLPGPFLVAAESAPLDGLLPERDGEAATTAYLAPVAATMFQAWQSQRTAPARWLLRAADYRLSLETDPQLVARFDVLTRRSSDRTPVRLKLSGVTFDSTEAATIDRQPTTIIPAMQGDGILVLVSARPDPDSEDSALPEWEEHQIEVRCGLPQSDPAGAESAVSWEIPPIVATELHIDSPSPLRGLRVNGREASGDGIAWRLGRTENVEVRWQSTVEATAESAQMGTLSAAASAIDIAPLRHEIHSLLQLLPPDQGQARRWQALLQPEWTIQQVDCPPGMVWQVIRRGERSILELADSSLTKEPLEIVVRGVRAVDPSREPTHTVPLSPLLSAAQQVDELLGIRAATGYQVRVLDRGATATGSAAFWSGLPEVWRTRLGTAVDLALKAHLATQLAVRISPLETLRTAAIDAELQLSRPESNWRSTILLDVSGASTARHELQLDRDILLETATAVFDGANRLARTARQDDSLVLILSRPLSGPLRIELQGRWTTPVAVPRPLPRVSVQAVQSQSETYRVINHSDLDAELLSPEGTSQGLAHSALPTPTTDGLLLTELSSVLPTQLVLRPGDDAAVCHSLTQLVSDAGGMWSQRQTLLIEPRGAPLTAVTILVPPQLLPGLVISPHKDLVSTQDDEGGGRTLELRPTALSTGVYRVQLQSPLVLPESSSSWEYELATCTSAQRGKDYLAVDRSLPFRTTAASGEVIELGGVVPRLRPLRRLGSSVITQLPLGRSGWTLAAFDRHSPASSCPLLESTVWLDAHVGQHGQTTLTLITDGPDRLDLEMPPGLSVEGVELDGAAIDFQRAGSLTTIAVPGQLSGAAVVVSWSSANAIAPPHALDLPRLRGMTVENHVLAVVAAGSPKIQLAAPEQPVRAACRRMAGLLTAVERLTTRTFLLDSPLLAALRSADAELERAVIDPDLPSELSAECRALRAQWQRLQGLIAVAVDLTSTPAVGSTGTRPWERLEFDASVSVMRLPSDVSTVPLQFESRIAPWAGVVGLWLAGCALWLLLLRRTGFERWADWLARRPAIPCLAIGLLWISCLQPRLIGVILVVAGLALLSRRQLPQRSSDTALIGPGR